MQNNQFEFIKNLADNIRTAVLPFLLDRDARQTTGVAFSGDQTFGIDNIAEEALFTALKQSEQRLAIYSEDKGLVKLHPSPELLLVVDPIDGTRPAVCGLESAVVSIALCRYSDLAKFEDIIAGVILEIKSGYSFYAESDGELQMTRPGFTHPRLSTTTDLRKMFWSFDIIGRPSKNVFMYLGKLIDNSGMQGAAFLLHSSAFTLTRIVTGQLDAHIDIGGRILQDHPESEYEFCEIGLGRVMGTFPYDIAAAYLILKQAGVIMTDAYGKSFEQKLLLHHGKGAVISCVAAGNARLHNNILKSIAQ